jgi:hypothetical protein
MAECERTAESVVRVIRGSAGSFEFYTRSTTSGAGASQAESPLHHRHRSPLSSSPLTSHPLLSLFASFHFPHTRGASTITFASPALALPLSSVGF